MCQSLLGCITARCGSIRDLLTIESPVAQWLEHPTRSRRVVDSNSIWDSDFFFRGLHKFKSCCCYFILNNSFYHNVLVWEYNRKYVANVVFNCRLLPTCWLWIRYFEINGSSCSVFVLAVPMATVCPLVSFRHIEYRQNEFFFTFGVCIFFFHFKLETIFWQGLWIVI